jgi:hypothetical protein
MPGLWHTHPHLVTPVLLLLLLLLLLQVWKAKLKVHDKHKGEFQDQYIWGDPTDAPHMQQSSRE